MSLTQKIRTLQKRAGLDDDAYRDLLEAVSGQRKTGGLSPSQQLTVVARLEGLSKGVQKPASRADRASGPYAKKLQALWMALHDLGAVSRRDDKAMMAFVEGQTKLSHTRFLKDPADARSVIEAFKAMAVRRGVEWLSERVAARMGLSSIQADRWAVIIAQAKMLRDLNADTEIQRIAFSDTHKPLQPDELLCRQILLGGHLRRLMECTQERAR